MLCPARGGRIRVGQEDFSLTAFGQDRQNRAVDGVRDGMGGNHHGGIGFAQFLEPAFDFIGKQRAFQEGPGFIENNQGRAADKTALDAFEQIVERKDGTDLIGINVCNQGGLNPSP